MIHKRYIRLFTPDKTSCDCYYRGEARVLRLVYYINCLHPLCSHFSQFKIFSLIHSSCFLVSYPLLQQTGFHPSTNYLAPRLCFARLFAPNLRICITPMGAGHLQIFARQKYIISILPIDENNNNNNNNILFNLLQYYKFTCIVSPN